MIEKMKKVFVVSSASKKEQMLDALMDLGVLHIAEKKNADRELLDRFAALTKTDLLLKEYAEKKQKPAPVLSDEEFEKKYAEIRAAADRKDALTQERSAASAEIERLAPWGDFSPQLVAQLKDEGLEFHFYRVGKNELETMAADDSIKFIRLSDVDKMAVAAVLGKLPPEINAMELAMPEKGLSELKASIAECDARTAECEKELKAASIYEASFKDQLQKLQEKTDFSSAEATAESEDDLVWISGYMPEADLPKLADFAKANGAAWAADDPAEDDDKVPTKVRYSKITNIIKPLFDVLGILPGYNEQDVSLWFLIFFTIFTAMIIGDAAYGVLFLIGAIVLTIKMKKVNNVVFLVYVLSVATIIWGAITGTWFGSEAAMKVPFLKSLVIPQFANYPEYFGVTATAQQNTIMKFSFTLGVIQIALGCLLSVRKKISEKNLSFIADIGWLFAACAMYLLSLNLVIGEKIAMKPVFIVIIAAFVIVVLFGGMESGKSFGQGVKAGLGNAFTVFLDTISCFGNVMSYIRLFAVGMASLAIAQSFNGIAENFKGPWFVLAIVVLLIGHGLNLIMGLLSVVVHGVRLNVLEFSGQAGLEWTGIAYEPFKKNDKQDKTETDNKENKGDLL